MSERQRLSFRSWFSPSIMWVRHRSRSLYPLNLPSPSLLLQNCYNLCGNREDKKDRGMCERQGQLHQVCSCEVQRWIEPEMVAYA